MPGGAWPGTGAILAAVETASERRARIGGKPEAHLFEMARSLLGGAPRVAMVGDRLASDIEGGRRAGLATILVLSGATSQNQLAAPSPGPTTSSIRSPTSCGEAPWKSQAGADPRP